MRRGEKEKRIGGDEKWRIEEEKNEREKAGKKRKKAKKNRKIWRMKRMGKKFQKEEKKREKRRKKIYGEGGVEKLESGTVGNIEKVLKAVDVNWSHCEGTFRLEKKEETHAS